MRVHVCACVYIPLFITTSQVLTYKASELRQCEVDEIISYDVAARGFECWFSRLRVQCSNHCAINQRGKYKSGKRVIFQNGAKTTD